MKYLLIIISFIIASPILAQEYTEKEIRKRFKHIVKRDKSDLDNRELRDQHFVENMQQIENLLETNELGAHRREMFAAKTIKNINLGMSLTFLHILQSNPTLLLNENRIEQYSTYIASGAIDKSVMKGVLNAFNFFGDYDENDELMKLCKLAREKWL